ncbi:MFS transporter, partial [Salmonella enterica subsp. enterica serovar Infantis]|nr:MFS transporter [Salmonella enterica subsp. enterica serovar Infantis]
APPNFTTFCIFRIVGGPGVGLAALTVPVYISESSCVSKLSVTLTGIPDSLK